MDFFVSFTGREQPLNPSIQEEMYRIGREALLNPFCHSYATRVEFELEYAGQDLRMRVRGNGVGIAPELLLEGRAGTF